MKSSDRDQLRTIAAYWHTDVRTGDNRGFGIVVRAGAPLVAAAVQMCLDGFAKLSAEEREEGLSSRIYEQLKAISDLVWSTSPDGEIRPELLTEKQMDEVIVFGIANVAILEAYERLTPNEHNGMQYIYERTPRSRQTKFPAGPTEISRG